MLIPPLDAIRAARSRITGRLRFIPSLSSRTIAERAGVTKLWLKCGAAE
jgi:hypothetical protein